MIQTFIRDRHTEDPIWQWSRWKLHSLPPRTISKLQLNYRIANLDNHLKTSWTEVLLLRIYRRIQRLVGRAKLWKGLTPHPKAVAENVEGYVSCRAPPREVTCFTPCQAPQSIRVASKRNPHNIWLGKPAEISCSGVRQEIARNLGVNLKGQCTKSHLWTLAPGCCGRTAAQREPEWYRERLDCVVLGKRLEGQLPLSLCCVPFPYHPLTPSFLDQALLSIWHESGEMH